MYILDTKCLSIHNSEFFQRIRILPKPSCALVVGFFGDHSSKPETLGEYVDVEEAQEALSDLFNALYGGARHFYMPLSRKYAEEKRIKDARKSRRGGS